MKKCVFLIVLGLIIFGGFFAMLFLLHSSPKVETFDLSDFQWEIENYPSDKNVGLVEDKKAAIEAAKALWQDQYGSVHKYLKGGWIIVAYDAENECWHISGMKPNTLGGDPNAIFRKSGEVLAVWIDD